MLPSSNRRFVKAGAERRTEIDLPKELLPCEEHLRASLAPFGPSASFRHIPWVELNRVETNDGVRLRLTSEYISDSSLGDALTRPHHPAFVFALIHEVASALEEAGVEHSHLLPDVIQVVDGAVFVQEFGLAPAYSALAHHRLFAENFEDLLPRPDHVALANVLSAMKSPVEASPESLRDLASLEQRLRAEHVPYRKLCGDLEELAELHGQASVATLLSRTPVSKENCSFESAHNPDDAAPTLFSVPDFSDLVVEAPLNSRIPVQRTDPSGSVTAPTALCFRKTVIHADENHATETVEDADIVQCCDVRSDRSRSYAQASRRSREETLPDPGDSWEDATPEPWDEPTPVLPPGWKPPKEEPPKLRGALPKTPGQPRLTLLAGSLQPPAPERRQRPLDQSVLEMPAWADRALNRMLAPVSILLLLVLLLGTIG